MKLSFAASLLALVGLASSAACPFGVLRDLGLLKRDDAAKIDAVRRDTKGTERLLNRHDRWSTASK
jgi:hypothetical protein